MMKRVLIVEDQVNMGDNLKIALAFRGFEASHVTTPQSAYAWLDKQDDAPDVVILDMNLESDQSGIDVGQKILARFPNDPPEFIIYSAYDDKDYYDFALRLNAAIYIHKVTEDYRKVITHARILAIRRTIHNNWKQNTGRIRSLARKCQTLAEVFQKSVQTFLVPQLNDHLGAGYFILLTHNEETFQLGNLDILPKRHPLFEVIQRQVRMGNSPVFQLKIGEASLPEVDYYVSCDTDGAEILERLNDGFMVSLYQTNDIELSMGIINPGSLQELEEHPEQLIQVIGQHFRATLLERLFSVAHGLAEAEFRKRDLMQNSAHFCFALGQMQEEIYHDADLVGEIPRGATVLAKLKSIGSTLREMGRLLEEPPPHEAGSFQMNDIIQQSWEELQGELKLDNFKLTTHVDCRLQVPRSTMRVIVKGLLAWFASRKCDYPEDVTPAVSVICECEGGIAKFVFKDGSKRITDELRKDLFRPFNDLVSDRTDLTAALGLHMAKMLTEYHCDGLLEDNTHQLKNCDRGHYFMLKLPYSETVLVENSEPCEC